MLLQFPHVLYSTSASSNFQLAPRGIPSPPFRRKKGSLLRSGGLEAVEWILCCRKKELNVASRADVFYLCVDQICPLEKACCIYRDELLPCASHGGERYCKDHACIMTRPGSNAVDTSDGRFDALNVRQYGCSTSNRWASGPNPAAQ